ncbi:hypothetical protein D915_008977 [Fasciola hepatica]|uniref:Osteopetrosis-associated transmembrane protein 1 n=1 Tax=Fasciola hepatica TaxID=6192 RepID=A0A4E0QZ95_FASHE|nr:hypothetical protein D915_008977 [Fasciola hepatica]
MLACLLGVFALSGCLALGCAATSCREYKNQLSSLIGSTSECFSVHLSPFSLCGWCPERLTNLHRFLADRSIVSPSGVPCVDLLLSDKSAVNLVSFFTDMWNRSFCSQCLIEPVQMTNILWTYQKLNLDLSANWDLMASSSVPISLHSSSDFFNLAVYNNVTVQFFVLLNDTLDCLSSFLGNTTTSILDVLSFPAWEQLSIDRSACAQCSHVYFDLLRYYNGNLLRMNIERGDGVQRSGLRVFENNRFAVCADIQNALNRTQWAWSKLFECHPVKINMLGAFLPLIICAVGLILFHALSYSVCRHPIQMLIYRPKRVELRLRPNVSTSHMASSVVLRDQLSILPSYGSVASSSMQNATSTEIPTRYQPFARNHNELSRL